MQKSFEKPRGQWMATDGRELYHNWVVDMINRHESSRGDYTTDFDISPYDYTVRKNLKQFSADFLQDIFSHDGQYRSDNMQMLLDSSDAIKYYTSSDDMLGESSNWHRAITTHSRDGLNFATSMSLGLALDAYESRHQDLNNDQSTYQDIADIMRDTSFQRALESVATTGFAVFENTAQRAMFQEDAAFAVSMKIGLSLRSVGHIIIGRRQSDGRVQYSVHPDVLGKLHEYLHIQNVDKYIPKLGSIALRDRLANDQSFTTGCPVRRAPASEVGAGRNTSAIALLADYMGSELERVVVPRFEP